jgi:site-specific recombinase XerD
MNGSISNVKEFSFFSIEEIKQLEVNFKSYLQAQKKSFATVHGSGLSALQFLYWLDKQGIHYLRVGYADLLAFVDYYKLKGNVQRTLNWKLQGIKHFYNYLEHQKLVGFNPVAELRIKGVVTRKPHDLLEQEDLNKLYHAYPTGNLTGKRNKAMLGTVVYQGLHSGEVSKLKLNDVRLDKAELVVAGSVSRNTRVLALSSVQILQLQQYITQVRPLIMSLKGKEYESDLLFISTGKGITLNNSLTRLMRKVHVINPNIKSLKQLRASVITCWLKNYSLREVQYMAGHRYVSSTEHYRTDNLETLQEQLGFMHPLA